MTDRKRKPGRPREGAGLRRGRRISLTDAEWKALCAAAKRAGMTPSAYVRQQLLG